MNRSLATCFWVSVWCLWLGCAQAAATSGSVSQQVPSLSPSSGETPGPAIHIPQNIFDFGEVAEGSKISHEFTVRNMGRATLEIQKVTPD
jgi:hypothetical protein